MLLTRLAPGPSHLHPSVVEPALRASQWRDVCASRAWRIVSCHHVLTVFPPFAADSHWPAVCVVVPASHRCHGRDHPGSILLEAMHCACACVVDVVSYPVLTFLAPCRTETKVYTTSSVHDSGEKQLLCGARVVCCVHTAVHLCPGNTS